MSKCKFCEEILPKIKTDETKANHLGKNMSRINERCQVSTFDIEVKMGLATGMKQSAYAIVDGKKEYLRSFSSVIDFIEPNFCPICGRKLKGE